MPPLSTHLRLAALIMPSLDIVSHMGSFLLGVTAPDAFEPDSEDSFSRHHFKGGDGRISLRAFLDNTGFVHQPSDNPVWSFTCGYYSHLWLDVFYRDHTDRLPFKKPPGISETDLRSLVRRETEILNAPIVLNLSDLPMPPSEKLLLPIGLKFVELQRCVHLFREVLKQSLEWLQLIPTSISVDAAEYAAFLEDVSKLFTSQLKAAA